MIWWSSSAWGVIGDQHESFSTGGSLRTVLAGIQNYEAPAVFGPKNGADALTQTLLRLTADGEPAARIGLELHLVQSVNFSTVAQGVRPPGLNLAPTGLRYRLVNESWDWAGQPDLAARLWVDRLQVKLSAPQADLTIGRQAITFGKAYFWNPLDVFLAFDPRQFDREYKPGVDAIRLDIPLASFAGVNLVGVSGRAINARGAYDGSSRVGGTWYGSALLARAHAGLAGWDLALQGGKVYGGYQVGSGFSGEVGPLEVRGEVTYLSALNRGGRVPLPPPDDVKLLDDHVMVVAGLGRRLTTKLTVEAEYLFNGAGLPERLTAAAWRVGSGNALHMSEHLGGLMTGYDVHPLIRLQLALLASLSDGSGMLQPAVSYSVSDESDFYAGAQVAYGRRPTVSPFTLNSEFGTHPNLFYGEYKFYF